MAASNDARYGAGLTILVVDDMEPMRRLVVSLLNSSGAEVLEAASGAEALALAGRADVVVLDNLMPDADGLEVLARLPRPLVPVVFLTADTSVEHAVAAIQGGAVDYIAKPLRVPAFMAAIERAAGLARKQNHQPEPVLDSDTEHEIVGRSPPIREALALAKRAAGANVPVLVTGPSGTGKELFARHIHALSRRGDKPFVAVNCAALPRELIESELFGHERGAFTGAVARREGLFTQAHGGTLFLDEVGELDPSAQAKLLRALQTGEITPVGGRTTKVDVRVIAATHRDLRAGFTNGAFREDLFYRLAVFELPLPSLKERLEDVPLLARRLLARFSKAEGRPNLVMSPEVELLLQRYDWPGNVRELGNALVRAGILCDGVIEAHHLPASVRALSSVQVRPPSGSVPREATAAELPVSSPVPVSVGVSESPAPAPALTPPLVATSVETIAPPPAALPAEDEGVTTLTEQERASLEKAMKQTGGNLTKAAELLGIGRATFYRKAKRYGLILRNDDT